MGNTGAHCSMSCNSKCTFMASHMKSMGYLKFQTLKFFEVHIIDTQIFATRKLQGNVHFSVKIAKFRIKLTSCSLECTTLPFLPHT